MRAVEVAAVGDNCIDRYLALRRSTVGGNAVNVAVHLARLGLAAAYYGAVGDDDDGRRVAAALAKHGVDTSALRVAEGRTAFTDIDVGPGGERIIAFEDFGTSAGYRPGPAEVEALFRLTHVHIGWLDDGGKLKQTLAAAGKSVSQDLSVNLAAASRRAAGLAVAFASAGPSLAKGAHLAADLVAAGAATAVVTCGALGSLARSGAETAAADAVAVEAVDTLGAGDTFIAGFLAARLGGGSLLRCLEAGRDAAAATCLHLGGFPQEPARLA